MYSEVMYFVTFDFYHSLQYQCENEFEARKGQTSVEHSLLATYIFTKSVSWKTTWSRDIQKSCVFTAPMSGRRVRRDNLPYKSQTTIDTLTLVLLLYKYFQPSKIFQIIFEEHEIFLGSISSKSMFTCYRKQLISNSNVHLSG